MNKFTKSCVAYYNKVAVELPEAYCQLCKMQHDREVQKFNPFLDKAKTDEAIAKLTDVCGRGYSRYLKMRDRLTKQHIIGGDPWALTNRTMWQKIKSMLGM